MTLGNIFEKLAGIPIMSIVRWYGRLVFWTLVAAIALMVAYLVAALAWWWFITVPWWFTLGLIVGITGMVALKVADPDWFETDWEKEAGEAAYKGERYKTLVGEERAAKRWEEIRELVWAMDPDAGCRITAGDEVLDFDTQAEALEYINKQIAKSL